MKEKPKMYIVKKYIRAISATQAIKKDRDTPVHDVWVDEDWKKNELASAIGFDLGETQEDD